MLEVGVYSVAEMRTILGVKTKQEIDRKLDRYLIKYRSSGRAEKRVYEIMEVPDPFKLYCVRELGVPPQADFDRIRNLYYYFFCVEGFTDLPLIEMAKVMEAEGVEASRQCVSKWIAFLRKLDYIGFTNNECEYYAISKDEQGNRVCKAISRVDYRDAWCIYFEWRDIEGCGSAWMTSTQPSQTIGKSLSNTSISPLKSRRHTTRKASFTPQALTLCYGATTTIICWLLRAEK